MGDFAKAASGVDTIEFDQKMAKLTEQVTKVAQLQKFEWSFPTDIQLQTNRQEFRNVFGFSLDFVQDYDLFGENKFFPKTPPKLAELQIKNNGQINLMTKRRQSKIPSELDELIAKAQKDKGELRVDMNFTPLMAHRYL